MDQAQNYYWWLKDGVQASDSIFQYIKFLDTKQNYIEIGNVHHMRLYGNMENLTMRSYNYFKADSSYAVQSRVTLNIVQSMVDTVTSKLVKNKPKPTFLTEGGDWSLQRKAQKLTQFVEGQFASVKFYEKRAKAIQGSAIFGTDAIKFYKKDGEICAEKIFINELIIDDAESIYGEPRQLHHKRYINKDVLIQMFPDYEQQIEFAAAGDPSMYATNAYDKTTDMLMVLESWHLKSGKNATDGKHAITIDKTTLFEEDYDKDYFPFVFWRWCLRPVGFWGQGLAEQLTGLQLEINKILRTIQVSMHLVSVPKLLVEASAKIVTAHLNNKIGGIIKYVGTKPEYAALGGIPPELFAHLDRLYARAFEIAGISQLSAQSTKPAGLNSGKALREYNDIESERFLSVGQRDEESVIEASKILIDLAKELDEELEGGYKVRVGNSKNIQTIKWSEVDMPEEKYIMQVFPTSALASNPSGRFQDVQELLQAGFISKEDGMKLLDFPDLREFYNFNNAGLEDIQRAIELIIDKNDYQTPEPYQNLALGVTKMQQAYLYYRANSAPEEKLDLFRRWIEDAGALLLKAAQGQQPVMPPSAPAAPPQPGMPQDATMPPQDLSVTPQPTAV